MIQSGGFLGRLLGPSLRTGLPIMKSVIQPLAKTVLIPLGLTAAASATIQVKIVKSLEDSGFLLESVSEIIKNEANKKKGGFPSMLLGTLGASQLGNMLAGKRVVRAGEGIIRAGYGSNRSSFKKKIDSTTSFNKL